MSRDDSPPSAESRSHTANESMLHCMKEPIQLESFLRQHSGCDGRGITIAILDSGVDPGLPGLQTTSTGERKLVECRDLTGAGNVDTSKTAEAKEVEGAEGWVIDGLTGRQLKIPSAWSCPTRVFHIGVMPLYDLYPKDLLTRIISEQQKHVWEPAHKLCVDEAERQLMEHKRVFGFVSAKIHDKLQRRDLNARCELLSEFNKSTDLGPLADCLVWYDGAKWRACIDTSGVGDISSAKVLTNFRDEHEYASLGRLNYCVAIHEQGSLLEVVAPSGAHGSHVASIAAAHYPDEPARSGMAPGAKLVSLNIGDRRLGTAGRGSAVLRALAICDKMGVDLINYSYGRVAALPEAGSVVEAIEHLVYERGITFVTSAGNNGPAIGTITAPITPAAICVAATLLPSMGETLYGTPPTVAVEATNFASSSRGPTPSGLRGITVCAPGAVEASVPAYRLCESETKNGTSMSSPNVAGSLACLMTASKARSLPVTPFRLKHALENSALMSAAWAAEEDSALNYGAGMAQIEAAFELLCCESTSRLPASLAAIELAVSGDRAAKEPGCTRGIYLREPKQSQERRQFSVPVSSRFRRDATDDERRGFCRHLALEMHPSSAPELVIANPTMFDLRHTVREILLWVDPSKLEPGRIHYFELRA